MTVRRPSLTARLAEQADRAAFAAQVLLLETTRAHTHSDPKDHYACFVEGRCRIREALAASMERIEREGRELLAEYGRRHG